MQLLRRAVRRAAADPTRRDFLRTGAIASVGLAVPSLITSCTRPQDLNVDRTTKVAVIGAGIAGLNAARILSKAGVDVAVYEGSTRTGGRMLTAEDFLVRGAVTELGGEFIDSNHSDLLQLAQQLELELIDLTDAPYRDRSDTYFFDGRRYTEDDIVREIGPFLPIVAADVERLPVDLADLSESPAHVLDEMSMEAYFAQMGLTGWLRSFLETAFVTENGLELGEQSALNVILVIGTELRDGAFRLYGSSDERYKIKGGNQQIPDRLAGDLGERIHLDHRLERIGRIADRYVVSFRTGAATIDHLADLIICAIPFSTLRSVRIDLDLPRPVRAMIDELQYGANAKTLIGFDRPFWHDQNASGVVYTDQAMQLVWDNTAMQGVQGAGLTMYSGGSTCRMLMSLPKDEARLMLLDSLASVWPDAPDHPAQRFERMNWPQAPFVKGSYSTFGPGQWSAFYGVGSSVVANTLFFAGEHTDEEFRGYMNGAARSGRVAAERVLQQLHA